ncbi:LOW QUALITY PROTEIN: nuclear receptor subfamily 0 group B member 1-like [Acanthochromis polyacanthus]|uniref:LOW QUALITY PROTEIN: nuclear receptor subfamily 0 group B member 1-like n=1 Tax=Acanthochromis polyacanthus TaxID=80966 RepID=UPI0022345B6F|nr:LOW QUALITY PROTEIN: nuclear receptor subfamily 0 group B member 1-like [Acanthochromis polyacanthus]
MATLEGCRCRGASGRNNNSILYSILKSDSLVTAEEQQQHHHHQHPHQQQTLQHLFQKTPSAAPASLQELRQQAACSCGSTRRRGVLSSPQVTCKAASAVLVKTLRFVKNVPCFRELPEDDQLILIRSGWAPLLVLGLAQDRVDFETTETVEPSMLQRILTGLPDRQSDLLAGEQGAAGVSVVDIEAIRAFLKKCWSVDISTKEYAYLKGAVLFNPDLEGLRCLHYIQSLRREAHQALNEHVRLIHREDTSRFAKLLIALSMLRAISPPVVAQLFFRPVIGTVNIEEVLMEMFYGK